MKLGAHPQLDALCGEYLVGTMRGAARRRFERVLTEEPAVGRRLQYWEQMIAVNYSERFFVTPSTAVWRRIKRDLAPHRVSPPWHSRLALWRIWAASATVALIVMLAWPYLNRPAPVAYLTVAVMQGKAPDARVTVELSADRHTLRLHPLHPVLAAASQSFELWLIPAGGAAPQPLGILGTLESEIRVDPELSGGLAPGAKMAVSVEPAGGSPTGGPTGPVIVIGDVRT